MRQTGGERRPIVESVLRALLFPGLLQRRFERLDLVPVGQHLLLLSGEGDALMDCKQRQPQTQRRRKSARGRDGRIPHEIAPRGAQAARPSVRQVRLAAAERGATTSAGRGHEPGCIDEAPEADALVSCLESLIVDRTQSGDDQRRRTSQVCNCDWQLGFLAPAPAQKCCWCLDVGRNVMG